MAKEDLTKEDLDIGLVSREKIRNIIDLYGYIDGKRLNSFDLQFGIAVGGIERKIKLGKL